MVERWVKDYFDYEFLGFLDDEKNNEGVIGMLSDLDNYLDGSIQFFIALGDNALRKTIFERIKENGCNCVNIIHPSAVIESDVKLGTGVFIGAQSFINIGSEVGDNTYINNGCIIEHHNKIGSHCHLAPGVTTAGDVTVRDLCLVGVGSVVMRGLTIGKNTLLGAGSNLLQSTKEDSVYYGNPAEYIRENKQSQIC